MRGAYTPQVQEAITRLGSRLTFSEAQEELQLMWGVAVSTASVRQITLRNGVIANELLTKEIQRLQQEAPEPTVAPENLVVSADGAMVQLTTGEWREVKTVAFGEFASQWEAKKGQVRTKTENISYFSRVATADTFSETAVYEWQQRGGDKARRVVAVNDGALWIQSFIDYHCPQATRVIDFAHAQGYVATMGKAVYGAETDTFNRWYAQMSQQLLTKPPQRTLSDLRFLQATHQDHPDITEIDQALRYLEQREAMIDYAHFRSQGIPIGSGIVESGHKVVMQRRMKQAGMRWAEENLNPMLSLRMAICNRRWHSSWLAIRSHDQQQQRQRRLQLATPPLLSQPAHPVTEKDCQRLTKLAQKIEYSRQADPWHNHYFIFPHRRPSLHKN